MINQYIQEQRILENINRTYPWYPWPLERYGSAIDMLGYMSASHGSEYLLNIANNVLRTNKTLSYYTSPTERKSYLQIIAILAVALANSFSDEWSKSLGDIDLFTVNRRSLRSYIRSLNIVYIDSYSYCCTENQYEWYEILMKWFVKLRYF